MVILYIILLGIILWGVNFSTFHKDYMSLTATNAIKGIFAVLILYSHLSSYLYLSETDMFVIINTYIGQLMVAMFLFYSGYGVMLSAIRKPNYVDGFFKNRIIKTLSHFDIAVLSFIILQLCLGKVYSRGEYILSWIGWFSVGNSNWFIFDILALYTIFLFILLANKYIIRVNPPTMILLTVFLCVILYIVLYFLKPRMQWWIDTIFTYPLGMLYARYKDSIDNRMKGNIVYYLSLSIIMLTFIAWHFCFSIDRYGICSCIFCLMLVLLCMRLQFNNMILQWLGTHAFAIYIMQRWPMLIFVYNGWNDNIPLFVTLSISSALFVAYIYQILLNRIDNYFFSNKK